MTPTERAQAREWQAIAYGDRLETWAALDYFRELGWPVDSNKFPDRERVEVRIFAFMSGYREALKTAVPPPPPAGERPTPRAACAFGQHEWRSADASGPCICGEMTLTRATPAAVPRPQAETTLRMEDVLHAFRNLGIDTECGECMAIAFTGYGAAEHTCQPAPVSPVEPEPCVWRADWREGRDGSILVPSCQPEREIDAAFVQECVQLHGWKFCAHCGAPLKVEREP